MPRDYKLYLEDIRDAIRKIEGYVGQASYEEFAGNDLMRDAVLYNLQVSARQPITSIPGLKRNAQVLNGKR
ncbi:MAG TPA: hypothetical protein VEW94_04765 [Chloroflexia bacterium]|nr:hypothetical protein [Chloroflexia bacterium]